MKKRFGNELLEIKPVALKRKAILEGDKVRYKIFLSAKEYVVVIAENALMALKISGISEPVRLLRDIPMSKSSIEEKKLVTHNVHATAFLRPDMPPPENKNMTAPDELLKTEEKIGFEPLAFGKSLENNRKISSSIPVATLLAELNENSISQTPANRQNSHTQTAMPHISDEILPISLAMSEMQSPLDTQAEPHFHNVDNNEDILATIENVVTEAAEPSKETENILSTDDIEDLLNEPRA